MQKQMNYRSLLIHQNKELDPFDFGTDAIERMRIAPPLSMLDADFEYGLQPTKWSAIGMMRGYPKCIRITQVQKHKFQAL